MRKQMPILDTPLNANERAMYNVSVRLDRLIELIEDMTEVKTVDVVEPEVVITPIKVTKTKKK